MNKIIQIHFEQDKKCIWDIKGLTQWNQGQCLQISGLDISNEIVEVHFSLNEIGGTAKRVLGTVIDGVIHTDIPAFILEGTEYICGNADTYNAYAWIYLSDDESAETVRKMEFTIKARSKPEGYVTPEELSFLQQLEAFVQTKLDKTGYEPNRYLATDEEGNVVTKEGPSSESGVGIAAIEQTKISLDDGGENQITIKLTNGQPALVKIYNGSKGSVGKSAYQYAQEGGYTGKEEEFAKLLANVEIKETDSRYFDIDYDGILSLKPEYRGDSDSNESAYPYSISDNGARVEGSKISELPEGIVIPGIIGTTAVTGFKEGMFLQNRRVKRIVLPRSVTSLPRGFARKAFNLESLENTEHIVNLGNMSLAYTGLKKALFPNLKTLGTSVFANSSNLAIVNIGNEITEIPNTTFAQSSDISCVLGGANITKIGTKAFAFNRRLKNLSFLSNLTSIEQYAFFDCRVNFEDAYQTLAENGCTFGSDATYKQINGDTDYWTGVEYTPCENPLRSLFHQKDPRWCTEKVGNTTLEYGANGCSIVVMSEIYSVFEQVDLESPAEFVEILESKNIDYSNFINREATKEILEALGYNVEMITSMDSDNLKKMYDALKDGALIYKAHMIYGSNSGGHAVLAYGVNDIGELLISDSSTHCNNIEIYENHLSSMPIYTTGNSNMDFLIVKKP